MFNIKNDRGICMKESKIAKKKIEAFALDQTTIEMIETLQKLIPEDKPYVPVSNGKVSKNFVVTLAIEHLYEEVLTNIHYSQMGFNQGYIDLDDDDFPF